MKWFLLGAVVTLMVFIVLFVFLHRLGGTPRHDATGPTEKYLSWLERSAAEAVNPAPGSDEERELVKKVQRAFTPFEVENVLANFPQAYADTFYFRDAFHTFTDLNTMVDYMEKSARISPGVTFTFGTPSREGIDIYLPWTMILPGKAGAPDQHSIGISRLRFNQEGKVIFHQDYWDSADVLVPRVPVANGLIEVVRRRF